jgi:hypothetical protein
MRRAEPMTSESEDAYRPVDGGLMSASRIRIVLFSESCRKPMSAQSGENGLIVPHPAKFVVVVPGIQKKFEHILISFDYSPRQRCISPRA